MSAITAISTALCRCTFSQPPTPYRRFVDNTGSTPIRKACRKAVDLSFLRFFGLQSRCFFRYWPTTKYQEPSTCLSAICLIFKDLPPTHPWALLEYNGIHKANQVRKWSLHK